MQRACCNDLADLLRCQSVFRIFLHGFIGKDLRETLDTLDMLAAFQITVLYNRTEYFNDLFIVLLDPSGLLEQKLVLVMECFFLLLHLLSILRL